MAERWSPKDFQDEGRNFIFDNKAAALWWRMGRGKTVTTATAGALFGWSRTEEKPGQSQSRGLALALARTVQNHRGIELPPTSQFLSGRQLHSPAP